MTPAKPIELPPEALLVELETILEPIQLEGLFAAAQPLEVELGSGDGSFLAAWAAVRRDRNFLGVERLLGRLRKLDRKGRLLGLSNLRGVRIEASYFLRYLLPPAAVAALHVYFPDPWPKRKHQRHRLVNEAFVTAAARVLQPGGMVYLRTDHSEYYEQMIAVFEPARDFSPVPTPADLAAELTDFERGFVAQGIPTNRAAYRRQ